MKKQEINYPFLMEPVTIFENDNGHKIVVAKKQGEMANISTWVKTGSINENDENNGVSHFLEHLMFKGTHQFKAGEFDKIMERNGGIINAATWKDYTFYYITISKKHFDLAVKMHADMMIDPVMPDSEIGETFDFKTQTPKLKRERYVVLEEINMRNDENWNRLYMAVNDKMYDKHPYKREVIGKEEIISSIKREKILEYYHKFYTPQNLTTIAVGDFDDVEKVASNIAKSFVFKENNGTEQKHFEIEKHVKNAQYFEIAKDVQTAYLMFGFLDDSAKNLKETLALDMLSTILGDGKSSRLNLKFIENVEKPHYYALETAHYQFKDGDNFFIQANFASEFKDVVLDELKNELKNLENIKEEELFKAKKRALVSFAQESETVSDIADSIGYYMTVCENLNLASEYEKILNEIDTTYLENIAKEYLNIENCIIGVLLPNEFNK